MFIFETIHFVFFSEHVPSTNSTVLYFNLSNYTTIFSWKLYSLDALVNILQSEVSKQLMVLPFPIDSV